jgi:hypothetical protein
VAYRYTRFRLLSLTSDLFLEVIKYPFHTSDPCATCIQHYQVAFSYAPGSGPGNISYRFGFGIMETNSLLKTVAVQFFDAPSGVLTTARFYALAYKADVDSEGRSIVSRR